MIKHEPEVRRAKARSYVESCNRKIHEAPWTTGRTKGPGAGGLYEALEFAEQAYVAHGLSYEQGRSMLKDYDPRRFKLVYDEKGAADDCVKILDTKTGRLTIWPHWGWGAG